MGELVLGAFVALIIAGYVIKAIFNAVLLKLLHAETDPLLCDALYFWLIGKETVTKEEIVSFMKDWENAR